MLLQRPNIALALRSFALCLGLAAPAAAFADTAGESLLANPGIDEDRNGDGWPDAWSRPEGATWEAEGGNRFLRMTPPAPDKMIVAYRVIDVKPEHKAYELRFRARTTAIERGPEKTWNDARIVVDFKDASGKKLKGPSAPHFHGSTDGWVERKVQFLVPEGAAKLEVMPALFKVQSGSFDVDDLTVVAVDPTPIVAAQEARAAARAEDVAARAAKVKPNVPPAPADKLPPELRVEGNQIVNTRGEQVWLQGVAIPSMEWTEAGENILQSTREAIDNWNAKVIRLGVREHFWAGEGKYQKDGGAAYRQLVDDVVNLAGAEGVYVVIDLHRFRAPEAVHAAFWREVAEKYKNHPAVMFELFNEPHDVSWDVWKNGGFVSTEKKKTDALTENKDELKGFQSIGMQALVDTVRDTGAKNIVIVGGLDWSYDLSGILNGYALDDRGGNGIVYSTHVYPWKSDWQGKFLDVAAKHPLFVGECGAPQKRLEFIPPERHEDPSTWVPDFLGMIQKHKLHWTGWSFHPKASPVMLEDWDYTPTPYWGAHAKRALAGERYELTKMR